MGESCSWDSLLSLVPFFKKMLDTLFKTHTQFLHLSAVAICSEEDKDKELQRRKERQSATLFIPDIFLTYVSFLALL